MGNSLCLNGGRRIFYEIVRKPVKNINLRVTEAGLVRVSANRRVSVRQVEAILRQQERFLLRALEKQTQRQALSPPAHRYHSGETFRVLGQLQTLQTSAGTKTAAALTKRGLLLQTAPETSAEDCRRCIERLLTKQCRIIFTEAAAGAKTLLQGRPLPETVTLRIRRMTSRWGSCIPAKNIITLSTRLLELPLPCIQAVVLHEYVHFLHADHSKDFYAELERVMPDYRQRVAPLSSLPYSFFYNE
ncbi:MULTISPECIES: M48 family metallopeptidase [Caproicibacterium]|uniref:SprT family zinc-dependent metalloprotease n=1 Tax=Caproicibacterium argilliputei TaxID=3030016 RepID=A0AA97DCV6_9FIRM|nr:SprT family zinc-dependent metalloprotease [Caproicibacterium argilliputei]WOC33160.1 SprT family zinc-dependent metalloprotease [Caproicibacterium argilliputei]